MLPQQKKAIIRDDARRRRAALIGREELSRRVWENLTHLAPFQSAHRLFAYASTSTEVETLPFLAEAAASGKVVALPSSSPGKLRFHEVADLRSLTPGAFGILEPDPALRSQLPEAEPAVGDIILVPGIAFTRTGIRLGHGAGFYDRFLGSIDPLITTAGLAFAAQLYPELPEEEFDVRVNFLVTDTELIACAGA